MENISVLYPQVVDDISSWPLFKKKGGNIYCIGSITQDKYIKVPEEYEKEIMTAVGLFDGNHTFEEIDSILACEFDIKVDSKELYSIFKNGGLTKDSPLLSKDTSELDTFSINLLSMDLEKHYNLLKKTADVLFPKAAYISLVIVIFSLILLPGALNIISLKNILLFNNSYVLTLIIMYLSAVLSLILHEASHALVSAYYGLKPKKMTFSLYLLFQPMLSLRIPGLYTVERIKRIKIWSAGISANLTIASLCIILYPFSSPSIKSILCLTFIINIFMFILNLSPFMPLDGYYAFSTALKMPNLRKKSFEELRKILKLQKPDLTLGFAIYLFISIFFMAGFLVLQVYWLLTNLINSIIHFKNIYQFVLVNRFLIILVLLFTIRKTVRFFINKLHKVKK